MKTAKEFLQKKYPQMRGIKWNTNPDINDDWVAQMMEEYASQSTPPTDISQALDVVAKKYGYDSFADFMTTIDQHEAPNYMLKELLKAYFTEVQALYQTYIARYYNNGESEVEKKIRNEIIQDLEKLLIKFKDKKIIKEASALTKEDEKFFCKNCEAQIKGGSEFCDEICMDRFLARGGDEEDETRL